MDLSYRGDLVCVHDAPLEEVDVVFPVTEAGPGVVHHDLRAVQPTGVEACHLEVIRRQPALTQGISVSKGE